MSQTKYLPKEIEAKWTKEWEKSNVFHTFEGKNGKKNNQYVLSMFPYPSGAGLHVGHVRIYTGTDILARYFRMKGYDVLNPMGWDAFGLPAENAAIKAKKNPMDMVPANIANFKRQMRAMGFSFDWEREFATTDPEYYKWTQWLFLKLYSIKNKKGERLVYRTKAPINWCPFCKTGLANEEVLPDGTHERCGNKTEEKLMPQWMMRITDYADRLLTDLDTIEWTDADGKKHTGLDWPRGILEMQKNWIGKKEGINITYDIVDPNFFTSELASLDSLRIVQNSSDLENRGHRRSSRAQTSTGRKNSDLHIKGSIVCFTTRPDTNFGATFIVLAPEHPFVTKIKDRKVQDYVKQAKLKTEEERMLEGRKKTGVFTGYYAVNNLNGRKMPIWVSDFVLAGFGTGAVVGVPGHDKRDFEFAQFAKLPIVRVVVGSDGDSSEITNIDQVQEEDGVMINSDFLNGLDIHGATIKIMDYLEEKGWGKRVTTYHLRDWIFSRQRYWGEPFPLIYCEKCGDENGVVPVSENELPVTLPHIKSYEPTETGESPLSKVEEWVSVKCPQCGGPARRETDTMPNWAGSCWYFLYFARRHPEQREGSLANASMPTFVGDSSPTVRRDQNDNPSIENWKLIIENSGNHWLPVDWYLGGAEHAVLHLLYARFWVKAFYDLGLVGFTEPFVRLRNVGMVLAADNRKMSKSLGNVVNPDEVIEEYGADTLRIYEAFMAPFSSEVAWSTRAVQGAFRFLSRVWQIYHNSDKLTKDQKKEDKTLTAKLQTTIHKITNDITNVKFNTSIASMMEFLNEWERDMATFNGDRLRGSYRHTEGVLRDVNFRTKIDTSGDTGKLSTKSAKAFLQLLAPFAPFITDEIWRTVFGEQKSIHISKWPEADMSLAHKQEIKLPVQVNGKVRDIIVIQPDTTEDEVVKLALASEKVAKWLSGKSPKAIYVQGKILNLINS